MELIKLTSEYDLKYRPNAKARPAATLRRAAAEGKIPGAFQMTQGGDWWVDVQTHDQTIAEKIQLVQMEARAVNEPTGDLSAEEQAFLDSIQEQISGTS